MPEGIAEFAHMQTPLDEMQQEDPYGFAGDGRDLEPELYRQSQMGTF